MFSPGADKISGHCSPRSNLFTSRHVLCCIHTGYYHARSRGRGAVILHLQQGITEASIPRTKSVQHRAEVRPTLSCIDIINLAQNSPALVPFQKQQ